MNPDPLETAPDAFSLPARAPMPAEPPKSYPPRLVFYHPNPKGTGCAVQFDLHAATADREGALFAAFANQKSVSSAPQTGARQAATFDWTSKITVKLNFADICHLLLVLEGRAPSAAGGKGLFHDTGETSTVIRMERVDVPVPGVTFEVSKKRKSSDSTPQRARILFTEAESLGLARLFASILLPLSFGR